MESTDQNPAPDVSEWIRLAVLDGLDAVTQGVGIYDDDLCLVHCNRSFINMLELPSELYSPGAHFESIARYCSLRGDYGSGDTEKLIHDIIDGAKHSTSKVTVCVRADGTTLEARLSLLDKGGYVSTYTNVTERRRALETANRLGRILDQSLYEIYVFDADTLYFTQASQGALDNLGYSAEDIKSMTPVDIKPYVTPEIFESKLKPLRSGKKNQITFETFHQRKDGSEYPVEVHLQLSFTEIPPVFVAVITDLTKRKMSETAMALTEQRHALHFEQTPLGVIEWDLEFRVIEWNPSAEKIFGYSRKEAFGRQANGLIAPQSARHKIETIWQNLKRNKGGNRSTNENITKDGKIISCEWYNTPLVDSDGKMIGVASLVQDITARIKAEKMIWQQANFDPLTGLPNRMVFFDRLSMAQNQAERNDRMMALHYLDLDFFKDINDTEGHSVGDLLLKEVSARLRHAVRKVDTVARLGGDEFAVIQTQIRHINDAEILATKLLDVLSKPFDLEGRKAFIGASIGITLYPIDDKAPEELLRNADIAMYTAKDAGRNRYEFYAARMSDAIRLRNKRELDLREAMNVDDQLFLSYQPQYQADTCEIIGVEALLRWNHPTLGAIPPLDFIPMAEKCGLIVPLGEWVLRTACTQNMLWQKLGLPPITVSVNISAVQFHQSDIIGLVSGILKETGLPPHLLDLEITESTAMQDASDTGATLNQLSAMGVMISLDDFGTGYSSLAYLKRFPLNRIKIDRSFVYDLPYSHDNAAIINAVITLSKSLGMKVIAEGVETQEQLDFLRDSGCDEIQGYFFSKPVTPEEITTLIKKA